MKTFKTLDSFYKRKIDGTTSDANQKGKRAKVPTTEHEQHQNQPVEPDGDVNETLRPNTHEIEIPDMKAPYKSSRYCPRRHDNQVSIEHYYRVDLFITTLDKQLQELNNRFNDHAMELLTLGSSLVFKKSSKVLDIDKICFLVQKYYPTDFTEQERIHLGYQLELFSINVPKNPLLSAASTLAELCRSLVETEKCEEFYLVDRLIRLILTLLVSTGTTERAFSAMKICKNRLRNKMSDDFLASNLVVYIEKEIADKFNSEFIIDEFKKLKGREAEL